jgi:hypothetical protein
MLNDIFKYADITLCEEREGKVNLEFEIRRTGSRILVQGDDLDDAEDMAWKEIDDQVWTVDAICREFDLTVDDIRRLVNVPPEPTSQYEDVPAPVQVPVVGDLRIVAAAQPFIAVDGEGNVYVTHEVYALPKQG